MTAISHANYVNYANHENISISINVLLIRHQFVLAS